VDKYTIGTIIVVAVIAVVWWGMYRSWKRRSLRSSTLTSTWEAHSHEPISDIASTFSVMYVATTHTESPLERLNIPGLGFRAQASVSVFDDAIVVSPAGELPTEISPARFLGVRSTQVTIDRVVEKDGLTAIDWVATDSVSGKNTLVTSVFRVPNIRLRERFEASLEAFGAAHTETVKEVAS